MDDGYTEHNATSGKSEVLKIAEVRKMKMWCQFVFKTVFYTLKSGQYPVRKASDIGEFEKLKSYICR